MKKLLVVDDDEQNLSLMQALLTGRGYEVETAVHGQIALEKAQASPPDLAISDILMPVMDGFTLCYSWMQDTRLRQVPFIFYTAVYTDNQDKELASSLGAAHFIVKPADPVSLVQKIEETIDQVRSIQTTVPEQRPNGELGFLKKYNERLIQKLEEKMIESIQANEHLKVLYQTSVQLNTIKPLRQLIAHALKAVVEALGYTHANYFVYDEDTALFHLLEGVGYTVEELEAQRNNLNFKLGDPVGLVGLVGQTKKPFLLSETDTDPRWLPIDPALHSALFLPLTYNRKLLGVVSFLSRVPGAFTEKDIHNVMTLTNNISLAIRNAQLFEAQQQYTSQLEEKVAERTAELEVALEKAEAATRLKSQFISDMNHELRTPLSNIKLYLQLLEYGNEENRPRYMGTLNREADRLQKMIEELLDLSRLDLGKTAVNLVPTNIGSGK